ncbi:MAG TPA: ATP-binding protein, partial [Longimicrobiales bacterium]
ALAKGLTLDCRVPAGSYTLETDPRKLRQILLNLTANAIKFTEQGRVAIDFQENGDVAPGFLFHVRDTGRGIEPEHLERIFEAFWQVQGGSTRTQGGTGLGLSVTRRLSRLLGGDVTVQSAPGEGSTFTVRLPRNPPPPDPAAAEASV